MPIYTPKDDDKAVERLNIKNIVNASVSRQQWNVLMQRVKQQDEQAFALIFSYFSPRLKQFAYKHTGNEQVAIEVVQEALAVVWQKPHLFDGNKSSLSTWIYTVARNQCFDLLRKHKGRDWYISSDDIWPLDTMPVEKTEQYSPETERLKQQVVAHLSSLPDAQKAIVQAVYLDELPHQQVADMYSIPIGTVKSRLRLAVAKLRHSIKAEQL